MIFLTQIIVLNLLKFSVLHSIPWCILILSQVLKSRRFPPYFKCDLKESFSKVWNHFQYYHHDQTRFRKDKILPSDMFENICSKFSNRGWNFQKCCHRVQIRWTFYSTDLVSPFLFESIDRNFLHLCSFLHRNESKSGKWSNFDRRIYQLLDQKCWHYHDQCSIFSVLKIFNQRILQMFQNEWNNICGILSTFIKFKMRY